MGGRTFPSHLVLGELPKPSRDVARASRCFRRDLQRAVVAKYGVLSVYHDSLCHAAARHELRASLLQRELRDHGKDMSSAMRVKVIGDLGRANDSRDRAIERLGLGGDATAPDPWSAMSQDTQSSGDVPQP